MRLSRYVDGPDASESSKPNMCPPLYQCLRRAQSGPSFRRRQILVSGCRAKARRSRSRSDAEGGLGAAAGSWTIEAGNAAHSTPDLPAGLAFDLRNLLGWDGAGAPGGPPKAEPGAGSAGRGAAGAALI